MSDGLSFTNPVASGVVQGKGVAPFTKKQVLSRKKLNELAAYCDSLSRCEIRRGSIDLIILAPGKMVIQISDNTASGSGGSGSGGVNYKGTYDPSATYVYGDIVRVLSGSSQGVYICVSSSPVTGTAPVFPEPAATGGTNTWDTFSIGITQYSGCAGGTSHNFYVNMLES